jgi:hypothetical protein
LSMNCSMLIFSSFKGTAPAAQPASPYQPVKPDIVIYVPQTIVHPK